MISELSIDQCVDRALELVDAAVAARFADEAVTTLQVDFGLRVRAVDHLADARDDGGACDGVSFLEDGVVLYAPTPNSRRENFTLAHELGHWLVESTHEVYDWLADQDDPGRLLETVCDRIAARMLLPESIVTAVIGSDPIRAQHLHDLFMATQASRPVCAIAMARYLSGLGAVVIIDRRSGVVSHASVNPDPERGWPTIIPWRHQPVDRMHPLRRLQPGASTRRRMNWATPWGTQAEFYVDATSDGQRVVAIFADADLWGIEAFHPGLDRDFSARPLLSGNCCGRSFERRGYPCEVCNRPFCPLCNDCRCDRDTKREVRCRKCTLQYQPQLVSDGLCVDCRT